MPCGTMVLREKYKNDVILEWFIRKYQGKLFEAKKSTDTNGKVRYLIL
jgi:hypothetical protein